MDANVVVKCLCYATLGYAMYAYDRLSHKFADYGSHTPQKTAPLHAAQLQVVQSSTR